MPRISPILHQRVHDYGYLIRRWRSVARARGLKLEPYSSAGGYQLFYARSNRPNTAWPWIYLSAGIHGDEPASTEACLKWLTVSRLSGFNVMIFSCLNP